MRKLSLKVGRAGMLCGVFLFQVACGAAFAETADAPNPAAAVGEAAKDSGPFGGCEPLGMTASGELVFPLECKHVLHKTGETPLATDDKTGAVSEAPAEGKSSDVKAAAPDDKMAVTPGKATEEKPAAGDTKSAAVEAKPDAKSDAKPAQASAAPDKPVVADKAAAAEEKAAEQPSEKASSKRASHHAAKAVALAVAGGKQLAMAKPTTQSSAAAASHVENKAPVRTAGIPACVHFRSYNPTSKSYLGFDGHMYACR
jgi:hypothetical protein